MVPAGRGGYAARVGSLQRRFRWCLVLVALLVSVTGRGCQSGPARAHRSGPVATASVSARASASVAAPSSSLPARVELLPPLAASADLVELPVAGHGAAVLSVPRGATSPRPSVIVLHGESDDPERPCAVWRRIVGPSAFVLCPRGVPREDAASRARRFTFSSTEAVDGELRAGLAALKARHRAHVAAGPVVLAGYSQGAAVALAIGLQEPSFFSRLVLVEGGYDRFTSSVAARYAERGGRRVLFACGRPACRDATAGSVHLAERSGVKARRVFVPGAGHAHEGPLADLLVREAPWLLSDDDRFSVADAGGPLGAPLGRSGSAGTLPSVAPTGPGASPPPPPGSAP